MMNDGGGTCSILPLRKGEEHVNSPIDSRAEHSTPKMQEEEMIGLILPVIEADNLHFFLPQVAIKRNK